MSSKFVGYGKKLFDLARGGGKSSVSTTITGVTPNVGTLKEFQKHKDEIIKSTDKYTKGLTDEGKIKVKGNVSSALSKLSKITKKKPVENKAKGGRVGLKVGGLSEKRKKDFTPPMKRQRKLDALKFEAQKTGGNVMSMDEMQKLKGESDKSYESRMKKVFKAKGGRVGLKGGSFPDLSGDGKTTFKDILIGRGVIKKGKKKMMAKKSETPMDKAVRKDKKKKRII